MSYRQLATEMYPPKPSFSASSIINSSSTGSHQGKVYVVTGGTSGLGYEVATALYHHAHGAKVYITGRSIAGCETAIEKIKKEPPPPDPTASSCFTTTKASKEKEVSATPVPAPTAQLLPIALDLSNLTTIRPAAAGFLEKEDRLDLLIHNAGVMLPPAGSKTVQGHDLTLGTNVLGPFLFNKLLLPLILRTAREEEAVSGSPPRVVWVSSNAAFLFAPKDGGIDWTDLNMDDKKYGGITGNWRKYGQSKAMDIILAAEMARRFGAEGVVSVSLHPGALKTGLQRHVSIGSMVESIMLYPAYYGALTELYAAFSPDMTLTSRDEKGAKGTNGAHIIPWGRVGKMRPDIEDAMDLKKGDDNSGKRLWEWCDKEVEKYL